MATGPFQILIDGPAIATLGATTGTATATTAVPHGLQVGATITIEGSSIASLNTTIGGTALWTVASVPSGTAFTFVAGTASAGTAAQSSAVFSRDLLNPVVNYSAAARPSAVYALPDNLTLESTGDGSSSSLSLTVYQDLTPAGTASAGSGPWYATLPDNARVRFIDSTEASPSTPLFLGLVTGYDVSTLDGGLGTITQLNVSDANFVLDRLIVRKPKSAGPKGQVANSIIYRANSKTERQIVLDVLSNVNTQKSSDVALQRLLATGTTSGISSTGTTGKVSAGNEQLEVSLGSLRSALDSIVELFQGQDGYLRRYWVDSTGVLRYELVSTPPTYATAPFVITTVAPDAPDGTSSAASTLIPRGIEVSYELGDITKRAYFLTADSGVDADSDPDPFVRTYNQSGVGLATRQGPNLEATVEAGVIRGKTRLTKLNTFALSYFTERSKPVLSGKFQVRGAGTQAHNRYGFVTGYASGAGPTYSLATWAPGQWVQITAPAYGIAAELFRVEAVSISFEPGSLQRIVDITFARRRTGGLARLVAGLAK